MVICTVIKRIILRFVVFELQATEVYDSSHIRFSRQTIYLLKVKLIIIIIIEKLLVVFGFQPDFTLSKSTNKTTTMYLNLTKPAHNFITITC
jgi:hypothetical protein